MTSGRPNKVHRQGQRARDLWITIEINLPTVLLTVVVEALLVVGFVLGWVL